MAASRSPGGRYLQKIQELREIKQILEKLNAQSWAIGWCDDQERWMSQLATEMEKLDSQVAYFGMRARKKYDTVDSN